MKRIYRKKAENRILISHLLDITFVNMLIPKRNKKEGAGSVKRYRCRCLIIIVVMCAILWNGSVGYAQSLYYEVQDRSMMCRQMVSIMKERQKEVSFYYPGIKQDMMQYKMKQYVSFFEDLSDIDAYVIGGVDSIEVRYAKESDSAVAFCIQYRTTLQQERYVDRKVRKLTRKVRSQRRIRRIQWGRRYLITHMRYDRRYYTAYDAFYRGKGNCMAYSYAFVRLMQELEVPCIYVSNEEHAWNMVRVDGRWYYVDITWEETDRDNMYFLRGKEDFPGHGTIRYGLPRKARIARKGYIS